VIAAQQRYSSAGNAGNRHRRAARKDENVCSQSSRIDHEGAQRGHRLAAAPTLVGSRNSVL